MILVAKYGFIILFLILVMLKLPVAFAMGISSIFYIVLSGNAPVILSQKMLTAFDSFTLLAIPLFMLAGYLMNSGGVTKRIFRFAQVMVGHIPGGLGHVNVFASLIFAGMSGSATADAGGLGVIEIEAMKREGYDKNFSAAVTAASSVVATIMPPSLGFVIYASMTGVSVGKLFLAGMIPAILITIVQMITVYMIAKKENFPLTHKASVSERLSAFKDAFFPLLSPVLLLGLITTGMVTPTEAALVAVFYSIILGIAYKELSIKKLIKDFENVARTYSKTMLIVSFAYVFGWILTYERIPNKLATAILSLSTNPLVVLIIVNILLLVLGCFMEGLSVQLITIPILLPLLQSVGIDLIQFGVLMELNLNIGLITPPVGVFIYLVADIAKTTFSQVVRRLVPFFVGLVVALILMTFINPITTFLPNLLMGA